MLFKKNFFKKCPLAFLTLGLTLMLTCSLPAFSVLAETTENTPEETYTYLWRTNDERDMWYWSDTPHYASNQTGELPVVIFRLGNALDETEFVPAYCCDISTGITEGTHYRRINLEDSTYYNDEAAGYIRGIFSHGYWPQDTTMDDVKAMEDAANSWLDANNYPTQPETAEGEEETVDTYRIHNLTAAQAISATQSAIWYYANTPGDLIPYAGTKDIGWTETFYDGNVDINEFTDEYTKSNVELFYEYLIHQSYEAPRKILFANDHFIESSKVESEAETLYNITLYFKLESPVSEEEVLTLTASLGSKTEQFELSTTGEFQPDADGYYSVIFNEVTKEEAESGIALSIAGYQIADDVYFYEAKPVGDTSSRDVSQNLVGYAKGITPVHAKLGITFDLPEEPIPEEPVTPDEPEEPKEPAPEVSETPEESVPEESAPSEATIYEAPLAASPKTTDTSETVFWPLSLLVFSSIGLILVFKKIFS